MRVPSWLSCAFALAVAAGPAHAAVSLSGYNLTAWTQKDGLSPSLLWALAQDADGYLWIGTDAGLLRFDGVRFVEWEAFLAPANPRVSVRALLASSDGTLWFGLGEPGGIGAIAHGSMVMFGSAEGLPGGMVTAIFESDDGVRAAGRFGLYRFAGGRWRRDDSGLPPGTISAVNVEEGGALSVATTAGVYRRATAGTPFALVGESTEPARSIARDARGVLWATDAIVGWRAVALKGVRSRDRLEGRGARLLHDSRGNLWVGTGGQGLWRYRPAAPADSAIERTSTAMGLSDDGVTDLLEDRDGNIWVATRDGLNRLTPHKMTPITDLGLVSALEVTREGDVFVGTAEGVVPFTGGRVDGRRPQIRLPSRPLAAMHADRRGNTLWVATPRQLMRVVNARPELLPLRGIEVTSLTDMTADGAGGLWLHDEREGLLHWRDGALTAFPLAPSMEDATLLASYTDHSGRAWFSFEGSQLAAIDDTGKVEVYGAADGLTAGPYRVIHEDAAGAIWFGGSALTRFAEGRFSTLSPFAGDPAQVITAIADDEGALWVAISAAGIIRISRDEVLRSLADRQHLPRFTAYDKADGSAGTSRWFGNRSSVRGGSNMLWFVAGRGVTVVDTSTLQAPQAPDERVRIEGAIVDGRLLPLSSLSRLPPRTARVQIDYTVLNLTAPHKTRFRYRLEGFDADWIDAGGRHSAFYTNLPPRDYTFEVIASSADGSFTTPAAVWSFAVRPMFYQTWWFAAACLAGVVAVTAAAWRLHVHRVRSQFVLLLKERARLSREVHDTLLQSMFGVALECDALHAAAPPHEPEFRERLRRLRRRVEADIREARQSILNLRSPRLEKQGLVSAINEVGRQMLDATGVRFRFELDGMPRDTSADVEEQLMRIGSEAIANVVRHAHASEVVVSLAYHPQGVTLTVADDGLGFEPAHAGEYGHIGLTTMRERASSVGGSLRVETQPGSGTTVIAVVPGKAA